MGQGPLAPAHGLASVASGREGALVWPGARPAGRERARGLTALALAHSFTAIRAVQSLFGFGQGPGEAPRLCPILKIV